MQNKLLDLMKNYRHYHKKKWTVFTHFIGVPLATLAAFIFFGWIKVSVPGLFTLSVAWVGVILIGIYYLLLDLVLGAAATIMLVILCAIASIFTHAGPSALSIKLFIIIFVIGWIFQLIGHAIEGKKPALLTNFFESVIIAPFFITAEVFFMLGYKKELLHAMDADEYSNEDHDK